jgi:hypothetical protein
VDRAIYLRTDKALDRIEKPAGAAATPAADGGTRRRPRSRQSQL